METAKQKITVRRADPVRSAAALQPVHRKATGLVAPGIQASLRVSSPSDPAEKEAESTARKVMRMSIPEGSIGYVPTGSGTGVFRQVTKKGKEEERDELLKRPKPLKEIQRQWESPYVARFAGSIQRKVEGRPDTGANVAAEIQNAKSAGQPLPLTVRRFMEPRFRADFSGVRIHTGDRSAALNRQVGARAFAVENQVFFGKDQFRPESDTGRELIAHELTHAIQQGSTIQRSEAVTVTQTAPVQVQRGIISEALDFLAEKAENIPGFTMLTVILGINPINMSKVDRSPANIFRAVVHLIPFGAQISKALDAYGITDKVANFAAAQIAKVGATGSAIYKAVMDFVKDLGITDLARPGRTWSRAKAIFTDPIDRIIDTVKSLGTGILRLIKDAILLPLAGLAQKLPSYDLLKAVMEKDPVTGDPYPRTPETVIGGFMKLAGQTEIWTRMQETKAVPKAWKWFQNAMKDMVAFVREIPALFVTAFTSLEIMDVVLLPRAFKKVIGVFGGFVGRFISWAGTTVWNLLEIIFDVVKPGALGYVKRTGAALKGILKNPLPFVGNLAKAAKLGFQNFAGGFLGHLKAGLIDWLTGSLPGVYIPKAFTLPELVKFVFSVLGISWANIRGKLVKVVGEPAVQAMETGFDIVKTLVTQGPAAAWDKIKEQLAKLQEMVIGGITDLVVDAVVKKAVPKVVAMFIPGAGFVSAIISIYDMVMTFVQKISKIMAVVTAFVDSIVAIAAGQIGAAAARVEKILAGLLSLAISFLAGFAGLGKVSDKIMGVIGKIRATIDKALDSLIAWIVTMAKKLGKVLLRAGVPEDPKERLKLASQAAVAAAKRLKGKISKSLLDPVLSAISARYGLKSISTYERGGRWYARLTINPEVETELGASGKEGSPGTASSGPITPEEQERQRKALEDTRTVLRALVASGAPKAKVQATVNDLRTRHRWSTLDVKPAGTNQFDIVGGFSPVVNVLSVDGALWVVQLTNVSVPDSARKNWKAYEEWVRTNVGRKILLPQAATRAGTATTEVVPPRASGRTSIPAGTQLPATSTQFFQEPVLGDRNRPDAAILSPMEFVYIEITLKADWTMLERGTGVEGRQASKINAQRLHKISQIPGHVFQLLNQFPNVVNFRAIIVSDAPPSATSKALMQSWLNLPEFQGRNVNLVWMIV